MKTIKRFFQVTLAYLLVSAKHRQKLAQFLHRDFGPRLYKAAKSWLRKDEHWRSAVKTFNACLAAYFLAVRPVEPFDLEVLRLHIQDEIGKRFGVDIGVSKDGDGLWVVWFSTPRIELTEEDIRPEKEVAQ